MNTLIIFPDNFVALPRHPGYFYNTKENHLYSIKVTGVLKRLRKYDRSKWCESPHYKISVSGRQRCIREDYLCRDIDRILKKQKVSCIPVEER